MTDRTIPENANDGSKHEIAVPSDQSIDLAPGSADLDLGLPASFGDSGPPLPAGDRVLQTQAGTESPLPRVHLCEPDEEPATPINKPHSGEMPQPQEFPPLPVGGRDRPWRHGRRLQRQRHKPGPG